MKILIPMMGMGRSGGERVLSKLANYLAEHGENVYITVPESNSTPYYPLNPKINIVKSKVKKSRSKIVNFIFNMYYLIQQSRKLNVDIALANYNITAYIVFLLQSSVNKFYYIQANEIKLNSSLLLKIIAFFSYLLPLKKIVNSKKLLPSYLNNYIDVLAPGIDLELFKTRSDLNKSEKFSIGFIGRKEAYKGSKEIIDALSLLLEDKIFSEIIKVNVAVHLDNNWKEKINDLSYFNINNDGDLASFYRQNQLIIATGLIEDGAFHYPCAEAIASNCLVISNYAPLSYSTSSLKLSTFDSVELMEKIKLAIEMDSSDRINELKNNYKLVEDYSWVSVGYKLHNILLTK